MRTHEHLKKSFNWDIYHPSIPISPKKVIQHKNHLQYKELIERYAKMFSKMWDKF